MFWLLRPHWSNRKAQSLHTSPVPMDVGKRANTDQALASPATSEHVEAILWPEKTRDSDNTA